MPKSSREVRTTILRILRRTARDLQELADLSSTAYISTKDLMLVARSSRQRLARIQQELKKLQPVATRQLKPAAEKTEVDRPH